MDSPQRGDDSGQRQQQFASPTARLPPRPDFIHIVAKGLAVQAGAGPGEAARTFILFCRNCLHLPVPAHVHVTCIDARVGRDGRHMCRLLLPPDLCAAILGARCRLAWSAPQVSIDLWRSAGELKYLHALRMQRFEAPAALLAGQAATSRWWRSAPPPPPPATVAAAADYAAPILSSRALPPASAALAAAAPASTAPAAAAINMISAAAALAAATSPASGACCSRRSARQAARLSACQPPPAALPPTTSSQPVRPAPAAASAPAAVAPLSPPLPPAMQAADEWFEVEGLIDQRGRGSSTVYRCRFLGYGEGADLWLPASQISEVALVAWRRGGQREWRQRQASQPASQVISSPVTMSDNCPTSGGEPAPAAPVRRSRRQAGQPSAVC